MDVIVHRSPPPSTLNPNAPLFVPLAYRTVEDFSDQCWTLVQSSPWFRYHRLRERFHDPQTDPLFPDIHDPALPDHDLHTLFFLDDPSPEYQRYSANKHEEGEAREFINKDLVSLGVIQWQKVRVNRALRHRGTGRRHPRL